MNNEFKELKRTAKLQQQRYGAGSNALLFSGGVSLFCEEIFRPVSVTFRRFLGYIESLLRLC